MNDHATESGSEDGDGLLALLADAGVLEVDDRGTIRATTAFEDAISQGNARTGQGSASSAAAVFESITDDRVRSSLNHLADIDSVVHMVYRALEDTLENPDPEICYRATILYLHTHFGTGANDAVPAAFYPVTGDGARVLPQTFESSVVYVWTYDCDPCEVVRDDLDELLPEPPGDIGLYAVEGSEWWPTLRDAYDVAGAPTLLFLDRGSVISRLVGPSYRSAIEIELDALRSGTE